MVTTISVSVHTYQVTRMQRCAIAHWPVCYLQFVLPRRHGVQATHVSHANGWDDLWQTTVTSILPPIVASFRWRLLSPINSARHFLQVMTEHQKLASKNIENIRGYLVTSPGSLAETGLGTIDPHDPHLQSFCYPCTPLRNTTSPHVLLTDELYQQDLMITMRG